MGKKGPVLRSSEILSNTDAKSTITFPSAVESTATTGTIEYATSNPTTFITRNDYNYEWFYTGDSSTDNTRWVESSSDKTIYDPSPAGYRVPNGGKSGFWATALGTSSYTATGTESDSTNGGRHWILADGTTAWYPAVSYRLDSGALSTVVVNGYCWSASHHPSNTYYAYGLSFSYNGQATPRAAAFVASATPCVV